MAAGLLRQARASQPSTVQIGPKTLSTLGDGNLVLPVDFVFGDIAIKEREPVLKANGYDVARLEPACNVTAPRDVTHHASDNQACHVQTPRAF
ncbi:MAG: hypothetical protein GY933_24845 [Hyphomicrobiales bacterium]|nr:hypothetical protein [Hyphomicrobiales bacterium]